MTASARHRRIRSFVLRPGRMTEGQKRGMSEGWPRYGLDREAGVLDVQAAFGREAPLVLEIGFGMGVSLVEMAAAQPELNFLGVEVHRPGVGKLLHSVAERELDNIRVYCDDAVAVLENCIADQALDGVQIFFPDPWHKKRHHKRRLVQSSFVEALVPKLKPGGFLHLATDWENYAEQMLEVLEAQPALVNTSPETGYCPRPEHRPLTKFEKRGQRLGHGVWDLYYLRGDSADES